MVSNTRRTTDPRRILRLKPPRPFEVEAGEDGIPLRLRLDGVWQEVTLARKPWVIDQHWWRADPVQRTYFRLAPADGPSLTVYFDHVSKTWFRQEY